MIYYDDLLPHQQRVIDEKFALDTSISKLDDFIMKSELFEALEYAEQKRLCRQFDVMQEYSDILGERIAAFQRK